MEIIAQLIAMLTQAAATVASVLPGEGSIWRLLTPVDITAYDSAGDT